jgi:hypothetical protein
VPSDRAEEALMAAPSPAPAAQPHLRVVNPDATPEEVAAIVAAVGAVLAQRRRVVQAQPAETLSGWVSASRLASRRIGQQRGPWRLAGRIGRRSRV